MVAHFENCYLHTVCSAKSAIAKGISDHRMIKRVTSMAIVKVKVKNELIKRHNN